MKKIMAILMAMMMVGMVSATEVDIDFDVYSGVVDVTVENAEAYSHFYGSGSWTGNFNAQEQGNYLDTDCLVETTTGAIFGFDGWQKLSGYTNKVTFSSFTSGETALLNNRFDNSNYVVQLERVDTGRDFLSASGSNYAIGWRNAIEDMTTETESAFISVALIGDGSGSFDTNQWHSTAIGSYGWGNPDSISAPSLPGYYTPTNTVSASGTGTYIQKVFGVNSYNFNGFSSLGGGSMTLTGFFSNGFSGTYTMSAR